jgi:hypothetical protein
MTAPAVVELLTQDPKHLHLNLEPRKGQGQLHDALIVKLGTQTFKIVLGGVELAVHMTKTMEWAHLEAQTRSLQRGLSMQIGYASVDYFVPDLA